jgi:hypothetical protein
MKTLILHYPGPTFDVEGCRGMEILEVEDHITRDDVEEWADTYEKLLKGGATVDFVTWLYRRGHVPDTNYSTTGRPLIVSMAYIDTPWERDNNE